MKKRLGNNFLYQLLFFFFFNIFQINVSYQNRIDISKQETINQ